MVVGEAPVVPLLLAQLLGGNDSVGQIRNGRSAVEIAADVAAPCYSVPCVKSAVQHVEKLIDGDVVAGFQTPLVGSFDDEPLAERMVGIACKAYIVVEVQSKTCREVLRGVTLAFILEVAGGGAYIFVYQLLDTVFPMRDGLSGILHDDAAH